MDADPHSMKVLVTVKEVAEVVAFVREADRNEVLEKLVEPPDVAGRVGRKVTCPLDSPMETEIVIA